ncbi:unnamed protein product, partial [Symbiodinium pilosum]
MGSPGGGSLREQLCQIEQSLGVCHVAEVQAWPRPRRPPAVVRSGSALAGSQRRLSPPKRSAVGSPVHGAGERPASTCPALIHQPDPPQQAMTSKLASVPRVPETEYPSSARQSEETDLDCDLILKLDEAVDKMIRGSVRRLAFGTDTAEHGLVVELGPASAPKEQGASVLQAAPRLPQQLAEIRQQLRQLSADCDRLQALAAPAPGRGQEEPLESVEA